MVKLENIVQLYSMQTYTLDKKWKQVCRINLFPVLSDIQIQRAMSSYNLRGFPLSYYPRDHRDHDTNVNVLNQTSKRGGFNYKERFSKFGNCDWFQRRSQLMKVIFFSSLA